MSISPAVRSDQIVMVGPSLLVPGLSGGWNGAPLFQHNFGGVVDGVNAVAAQGALLVPFRAKILAVKLVVRAAMGTGAAVFTIGDPGDADRYITKSVPTTDTAGAAYTFVDDDDFNVTRIIAEDTPVFAGSDGGATSTGSVDLWMLYTPY